MSDNTELMGFVKFLFTKTYLGNKINLDEEIVSRAFEECCHDVRYHDKDRSDHSVLSGLTSNSNELPIFLYRLGNNCLKRGYDDSILTSLHWILRECCSCEIYFNNKIDIGLKVVHGVGTVIGSRNQIGKGFTIYQGCTIGHKVSGGPGNVIDDDVTLYANSLVLGSNIIGSNVLIGANSLVITDIPSNSTCLGSPVKISASNP